MQYSLHLIEQTQIQYSYAENEFEECQVNNPSKIQPINLLYARNRLYKYLTDRLITKLFKHNSTTQYSKQHNLSCV